MSLRMRKRIKILPGIYINLSRSGISTSVGIKGASVTTGHGKTHTNIGIPGTGISYSKSTTNKNQKAVPSGGISVLMAIFFGIIGLFLVIVVLGLFHII